MFQGWLEKDGPSLPEFVHQNVHSLLSEKKETLLILCRHNLKYYVKSVVLNLFLLTAHSLSEKFLRHTYT